MTKKALFISIAAAVTLVFACGDATDPGKNSSTVNVSTNNTTTSANNTSTSANNTSTSANNMSTANNSTTTSPNNSTTGNCEAPDPSFFGQIGAEAPGGGAPDVGGTYDTDANLQAVFDAMPTDAEEVVLDTPITVTDALVVSTGFVPNGATSPFIIYLADANTALELRLPQGFESPIDFATGMIVSFDVLAVENFSDSPQISNIENLTMTSEGNSVPVIDGSARALTPADWGRVVKVGGTLSTTSNGCGGESVCYTLDYGNGTVTFRTESQFIEPGDCVTFVGPLRSFPGPIGNTLTAGDLQVDQLNFNWVRTPFE